MNTTWRKTTYRPVICVDVACRPSFGLGAIFVEIPEIFNQFKDMIRSADLGKAHLGVVLQIK